MIYQKLCRSRICRRRFMVLLFIILIVTLVLHLRQQDDLLMATPQTNFDHFKWSRNLGSYIQPSLSPLIEPSSLPCQNVDEVPVLVMVTSGPGRLDQRHAIRRTWATAQPTVFFLGLHGTNSDEQLVENYVESKQYNDIVVFDFKDVYQNLTLKSALMMQWTLRRCPHAEFVLKTDDDVFVNPWRLREVLRDNVNAQLVGHKYVNSPPHRNPYHKWFLPYWLWPEPTIPEFLSGTSYVINGVYLERIYAAAYKVPLIHLEDIFFTYLVSKKTLGLRLSHDKRLNPHRPIYPFQCAYWSYATMHSMSLVDMAIIWPEIKALGQAFDKGEDVCTLYKKYLSFLSNYMH